MRIVFDTNVLLSATLWDKSVGQKLLFLCIDKDVEIVLSQDVLHEYEEVLHRDFGYEDDEITEIVQNVLRFATLVKPSLRLRVVIDDPDDDRIVECAFAARANYIASFDKHLLNIREYHNIKIITPPELLRLLKG